MQIRLFQALKSVNVPEDKAIAVVTSLEAHVESVVNNNIKAVEGHIAVVEGQIAGLEGKLTGVQATLDAMKGQVQFVGVMIGIVGLAIAAGPIVARFVR